MRDDSREPKLTYALDILGKMVHISSVERGLSCNCRCPKCNESLVAKLGHKGGRQAHFAHRKGSDCHGSYMSALHKLAEQIIEEEMAVMVPTYKEIDKQKLEFEKVEVEQRVERKDLQPDIVGVSSNGLHWFIEIRNTHEVDETKKAKLIESEITCLEIDVRQQKLENLKSFLLESAESREWINNPNYESRIEEAKRNIVSQIERLIIESKEIAIPIYADTETQIISIKENISLSKSEDGLYVRLKVISSDDISYVFEIGSYDIIETTNDLFTHDCNELIIYTDNLSLDSVITMDALDIKWSYHFETEKERELRIKEYNNNPRYEVRLEEVCHSECKYNQYKGECIYSKEIISLQGVDYVVCDRRKMLKDEADVSSRNQINSAFIPTKTMSLRKEHEHLKDKIRERDYTTTPQINQTREESRAQSPNTKLSGSSLPFDRFWTIEEYYSQLQLSGTYETKKGLLTEMVKCDMADGVILLLYKDPDNVRTYTPFHAVVINVSNGDLVRNEVSAFTNKEKALNAYYARLRDMKENDYMKRSDEISNNELPF